LSVFQLAAPVISQTEVEIILDLEAQIRRLRRTHAERCANILDRYDSGEPVEPGSHSVTVETTTVGARRIARLYIDGRRTLS
jgi:hypothetical protein